MAQLAEKKQNSDSVVAQMVAFCNWFLQLICKSVRISGQYSRYNGYTHHYRIYSDDGEDYYYISSNAKFTTLRLLVHHHSNQLDGMITTLRYPAIKPTKPPVSSLCNEVDKWEINRSDLVLGAKLGTGQYSEVYKAMIKSQGKTVAVKTFKVFCWSIWFKIQKDCDLWYN